MAILAISQEQSTLLDFQNYCKVIIYTIPCLIRLVLFFEDLSHHILFLGAGNFTIFAPTNAAFAKLDPDFVDDLFNDPAALTSKTEEFITLMLAKKGIHEL